MDLRLNLAVDRWIRGRTGALRHAGQQSGRLKSRAAQRGEPQWMFSIQIKWAAKQNEPRRIDGALTRSRTRGGCFSC